MGKATRCFDLAADVEFLSLSNHDGIVRQYMTVQSDGNDLILVLGAPQYLNIFSISFVRQAACQRNCLLNAEPFFIWMAPRRFYLTTHIDLTISGYKCRHPRGPHIAARQPLGQIFL